MADDLTTPVGVEAVLADTAGYDVDNDLDKARRRVRALRRKLDMPQSAGRGDQTMAFFFQATERQLASVLAFCARNSIPTNDQLLADPQVVHGDFGTTGKYLGGAS